MCNCTMEPQKFRPLTQTIGGTVFILLRCANVTQMSMHRSERDYFWLLGISPRSGMTRITNQTSIRSCNYFQSKSSIPPRRFKRLVLLPVMVIDGATTWAILTKSSNQSIDSMSFVFKQTNRSASPRGESILNGRFYWFKESFPEWALRSVLCN